MPIRGRQILVTGGSGVLGRQIVSELDRLGARPVVLSRRPGSGDRQADLVSGAGLDAALQGIDTVVHAATSIRALEDLQISHQVVEAAKKAEIQHLVYVGIVGSADQDFDYYRAKSAGEQLVERSGVPFTIQRATQFFEFVDYLLQLTQVGPVQLVPPGARLQPVDSAAVARKIAGLVLEGKPGPKPELAGPQILDFGELAREWAETRQQSKLALAFPVPHPAFRAMRTGRLVPLEPEVVGGDWRTWLKTYTAERNPYQR